PRRHDLLRPLLPLQRAGRRRAVRADGDRARSRRAGRAEGPDPVDEGGDMTFAVLGDFGGGISFIFTSRQSRGGAEVGGAHNLDLLWTHLELTLASMGLAMLVALPVGLILGHLGRWSFLAISTSNVGRAVPSIALIAFFVAFFPQSPEFLTVTLALALL